MADASVQIALANYLRRAGLAETIPLGLGLCRRQGGTGFSVDTLEELQTELEIVDPFSIAGVEGGFAALDSGLLVPRANLPELVGADSVTAGEAGVVPAPAAGAQLRPLTGGGDFSNQVEIDKVFAPTNATKEVLRIASTGDGENRWTLAARGSTTHNSRLLASSSVDDVVHARVEPQAYGWLQVRGDPVAKRLRSSRRLRTKIGAAGFYADGLEAPTEFGTVTQEDTARAFYQVYQYTDSTNSVAGLTLGALVERRWTFDVLFVLEVQLFANSRFWCGLFNGDPSGSSDPNTLQGFGIRFDSAVDTVGTFFRVWSSDGSGASTVKVADGSVSGFNPLAPTVNVQLRILLRNIPNTPGRFEAWGQLGSDDSNPALEGSWYFLGVCDSATDKVPSAATQLAPWVTHTNLATTNSVNRKIRVHAIDVS